VPPPQPAAIAIKANTATEANAQRPGFTPPYSSPIIEMINSEPASGQYRPEGPWERGTPTTWDAAVEVTVIVVFPVVFDALSVMVLGAVKFCAGVPKVQPGKFTALAG